MALTKCVQGNTFFSLNPETPDQNLASLLAPCLRKTEKREFSMAFSKFFGSSSEHAIRTNSHHGDNFPTALNLTVPTLGSCPDWRRLTMMLTWPSDQRI